MNAPSKEPNIVQNALRTWAGIAFVLLAGCGGSGSGGGSAPASATPSLSISSVTPATGPIGSTVSVIGTRMDTATGAKLSGVNAAFAIVSPTQLDLTVPIGATSGRIEVSAGSSVALSPMDFSVAGTPIPVIATVTPASVLPGGRITVTGSSFDQVSEVRLGAATLVLVSSTPTTLVLDVPAGASTDFLTLVDNSAVARQSLTRVTVLVPMTVTSYAPTTVARGHVLSVTGTDLDRATSVIFGGGAVASVSSHTGSTVLTAVVPVNAGSGVFTVSAGSGDIAVSGTSLTVVDPIIVVPATYSVALGANVTIAGSGLTQVSGVTVGASAAVIVSQSATQLVFAPPAGIACGSIALQSLSQPPVFAGSVLVGTGCTVRTAGVEFAQVLSQATSDPFERLVPGKEVWVRAYVVSTNAATPAPLVRAVGFVGATLLGMVTLGGPATLPVLAAGSSVPANLRNNDAQSYNAELPAAWMTAGMRVRIEVDPQQQYGPTIATDAIPVVGTDTLVNVVVVPLISGPNVPTMPPLASVLDELTRRMPVPRSRITVSQRAPYPLTSVTNGVDTEPDWTSALSELENLRALEAPTKQYYGLVRPMVSAGIAGIGYVNPVSSFSPALSALGWDATYSGWNQTMVHEFGHNYSRLHAPSGGAAGTDPDYPYAGGFLGPTPLFDSLSNRIISPAGLFDVMGYENGNWFSDYNLREVQRFLEARPQTQIAASVSGAATAADVLVISGVIDADGVHLSPVHAVRGRQREGRGRNHVVRVTTRTGAVIERAFEVTAVDHATGEAHFRVDVPDPGELASIAVLRDGHALPLVISQRVAPAGDARAGVATIPAGPADGPWAEAALRAGMLEITWNAAVTPYATISLVNGDARQILAVNAGGGRVAFAPDTLPEGGELEISVSDGLNARVLRLTRP